MKNKEYRKISLTEKILIICILLGGIYFIATIPEDRKPLTEKERQQLTTAIVLMAG